MDRLHADDHSELGEEEGDLGSAADQVRGEEVHHADVERPAQLRERHVGIPGAASRDADRGPNHEDGDIAGDGQAERSKARSGLLGGAAAERPARERQQDKEIGQAEPERRRGVRGDVLEDPGLARERRDPEDLELFEEERAAEDQIDAEERVPPDADDDERRGERQNEPHISFRNDDRAGRRTREE